MNTLKAIFLVIVAFMASTMAKLTKTDFTIPEVLTKSLVKSIDLGYFIDFSNADFEKLKFTPPYGDVKRLSYKSFEEQLDPYMINTTIVEASYDFDPLYWLYVRGWSEQDKICEENLISRKSGTVLWIPPNFTEQQCSSYKLFSIQEKKADLFLKVRLLVKKGFLYSYVAEGSGTNSGGVELSENIRIDARQFIGQVGEDSPKALIYQRASDTGGNFKDLNLIVYQDLDIISRIGFFNELEKRQESPKVEWVNYSIKNPEVGFLWIREISGKSPTMRFNIHFITDESKSLEFAFEFDFVNPGWVGLTDENKKYIEIDGVLNTANVCLFDPAREYLKYSDFKDSCITRKIKIDLDPADEYISSLEYSNYDSILLTISSRKDVTKNRYVWDYIDNNLKPSYDFSSFLYLQTVGSMWEIPIQINAEKDLNIAGYMARSTSYFLLQTAPKSG